jgi:hypothetical protein
MRYLDLTIAVERVSGVKAVKGVTFEVDGRVSGGTPLFISLERKQE